MDSQSSKHHLVELIIQRVNIQPNSVHVYWTYVAGGAVDNKFSLTEILG